MRGISGLGGPSLRVFADAQDCCQLEWESFLLPRYSSRLEGEIRIVTSIKEANVLIVSGHITEERKAELQELHSSMKKPGVVIAMGICQMGGWLDDANSIQLSDVLPVSQFIPGCAPSPDSLVNAFNSCFSNLKPSLKREEIHASINL